MAITTPVLKDIDAVFPGEAWFFYWKTSATLWESKIAEHSTGPNILIPVNWAFHSDTGDKFDFGESRPETDLKKLIAICKRMGKEPILLLPLTPVPYLPNGGVPFLLAKSLSLNEEELATVAIDNDGNIHKMYSFFEPKVFRGFQQFVMALGNYFSREGIACRVWSLDAGHMENKVFKSYFIDRSATFNKAFTRFLSVKKSDEGIEVLDVNHESFLMKEFHQTIYQLYDVSIKKAFPLHWEGVCRVSFLGGGDNELMWRFADTALQIPYIEELFASLAADVLPCSALLPIKVKSSGALKAQLKDIVSTSITEGLFSPFCSEQGDIQLFKPLYFFEIYGIESLTVRQALIDYNFYSCSGERIRWNYRQVWQNEMPKDWAPSDQLVSVFSGIEMSDDLFATMLKQFMRGGQVLFDRTGLSESLNQRLEVFLIENSLCVDHIHFVTQVQHAQLGEGRLVVFDGQSLLSDPSSHKKFWEKIFSLFRFRHINLEIPDGIEYYWRTRSALMHELSYDEVRRLSFYNCSSYKKRLKFSLVQSFAFMKIVDQINAVIQSGQNEHEIELMPGASISLDFGVFS